MFVHACICISMLDGRKGRRGRTRRKRSLPVSFICLEKTEFNEETKLSSDEKKGRGEKRGAERRADSKSRRVCSKTVARIHAAICASDDLTEPMNRVPTKFFSVRGGALSRDAINSPTINSPVSLLRGRERGGSEGEGWRGEGQPLRNSETALPSCLGLS